MSSTGEAVAGLAPGTTSDMDLPSSVSVLGSAFENIKASTSNATSLLSPSPRDLIMAVPRIMARAGSFAFITLPERMDNFLGLRNSGSVIAEATGERTRSLASAALTGASSAHGPAAATAAGAGVTVGTSGGTLSHILSFQHVRNFGGVFTYMTSKWALACFTLAIVLNRTQVYASSRRHINLNLPLRLFLRIMPILMFLLHAKSLLQAMRCQSSPNFSNLKYGNPDKHLSLDFSEDGGLLYSLSSTILFWQGDRDSCLAVNMIRSSQESPYPQGSLALLWPLFKSLCFSQFIETLSCAIQGRPLMTETGMSIFEHSLAFAEAEAMISNQLGLAPFGPLKTNATTRAPDVDGLAGATDFVSKSILFDRLNTPPEVLLMGLISCLNNLSSHVLGVLNMQGRFRLINTGIWGLCFMSSFVWGFFSIAPQTGTDAIILRFPTVCIVGFIPHLLILIGICICAFIYFLALLLSVFSAPTGLHAPRSWLERLQMAHENLQANIQLSTIRLNMHEDFYTALLKVGFTALTVASEAVYLNEGRRISVGRSTWLEEERMKEFEIQSFNDLSQSFVQDRLVPTSSGVTLTEDHGSQPANGPRVWKSGYAREKTTKILKSGHGRVNARMGADGVGALQRSGRYVLAWEFFSGIFWLTIRWLAMCLAKALDKAGIARRPQWLSNLSRRDRIPEPQKDVVQPTRVDLEFWLLSDDGVLSLPENDNVDVEVETKRRLGIASNKWGDEEEKNLDSSLYGWWKSGGWWGEKDESGTYHTPNEDDDNEDEDNTSVISMSTATDWETDHSDHDHSGASTPTQRCPHPQLYSNRSPSPFTDAPLDHLQLARLLDPKDADQRLEAHMLAHHLTSPNIITRSQYKHALDFEKAHILTSTRYRPKGFPAGRLTPQEEAEVLEYLILARREESLQSQDMPSPSSSDKTASATAINSQSWRDGASGLGSNGPQCVVCQSSPRTVLAWPCRCLSLCEECRVSLAMNNFGTCVCCRQEVVGFSRLFVP